MLLCQLWLVTSFFEIHRKFHFTWKKIFGQWIVNVWTLQTFKTHCFKPFWLSNWVSVARVAASFLQASLLWPAATAAIQKRPVFVLARLTRPSCAGAKPLTSFVVWNSLWEWLPNDMQGLQLGLKLELCSLTNELSRVYLFRSPWINQSRVWGWKNPHCGPSIFDNLRRNNG